jgi:hypothetical protein
MELTGIVQNGVIVLENAPSLQEGTRVRVTVEAANETEGEPTLAFLSKYAGCIKDLPSDFAAQHDHYIHGTPKK